MNTNDNTPAITALEKVIERYRNNIEVLLQSVELLKSESPSNGKAVNGESNNNQPNGRFVPPVNVDSAAKRIISIMKAENRFLFRKEIEEIAAKQGKPFNGKISSQMSDIKKKGKDDLYLFDINHSNKVWGFSSYLDKDGNIKPEHMFTHDPKYFV